MNALTLITRSGAHWVRSGCALRARLGSIWAIYEHDMSPCALVPICLPITISIYWAIVGLSTLEPKTIVGGGYWPPVNRRSTVNSDQCIKRQCRQRASRERHCCSSPETAVHVKYANCRSWAFFVANRWALLGVELTERYCRQFNNIFYNVQKFRCQPTMALMSDNGAAIVDNEISNLRPIRYIRLQIQYIAMLIIT